MNEWKVIFATVVIFGTGVISGGLLVNYANLSHLKDARCAARQTASDSTSQISTNSPPKAVKARLPEILSKQFVDRLETDLQLTLGQRADIEKIIADGQDEAHKEFQNIRAEAREKIRKQLTPRQVKEFDELFKQLHPPKKPQNSTNAPSVLPAAGALPVARGN